MASNELLSFDGVEGDFRQETTDSDDGKANEENIAENFVHQDEVDNLDWKHWSTFWEKVDVFCLAKAVLKVMESLWHELGDPVIPAVSFWIITLIWTNRVTRWVG